MWGMQPTDHLDTATKYRYFGRPKKLPLTDGGERVKPMSIPEEMVHTRVYLGDNWRWESATKEA